MWSMGLGLIAALPAWGEDGQSLPVLVRFEDRYDLLNGLGVDTGYLPSPSDPVSVRFFADPRGDLYTTARGQSDLAWQEGQFEHLFTDVTEPGQFGVDAGLTLQAELSLNIPLVYSGVVPVWSEDVGLTGATPMLGVLPEEPLQVSLDGSGLIDPYELEISLVLGVSLVFAVTAYPSLQATLEPLEVRSEGDREAWVQSEAGVPATFAVLGPEAALPFASRWVGLYTSTFSVVVEPSASVDTFLGPFELLTIPIAIPLVDTSEERETPPVDIAHPLPQLGELPASLDFGDVAVGSLSQVELLIEDLGELELLGALTVEGSPGWSVFPEDLVAFPGRPDGIVLTFAPTEAGPQQGSLVLTTQDPAAPRVEVSLAGRGVTGPGGVGGTRPDGGTGATSSDGATASLDPVEPERQCACASTGRGAWPLWLALSLLLPFRRKTGVTSRI